MTLVNSQKTARNGKGVSEYRGTQERQAGFRLVLEKKKKKPLNHIYSLKRLGMCHLGS